METRPDKAGLGLRAEAFGATGVGVVLASVVALAVHGATGSWLATGLGAVTITALLGLWLDYRLRATVASLQTIAGAADALGAGRSVERIDADTLGRFAGVGRSFNALRDALAQTASRVIASMLRVRGLPERISAVLREIQKNADRQEEAVEETASLLANINSSIRLIEERIQNLSSSADESSSAILQMGSSVEEVARNTASLHEAFESSSSAVHEMSASIRQVAESADMVRQMAEESSTSMNEMDRSIQEVSGHAQEASNLTESVSQGARDGSDAVTATIRDIEQIHSLTNDAKAGLGQLVSRIKEISQIMNVIGEINDETNLLSLNAAIIAAQAGEQGKAFLVVANHVKTLATRTAASTKHIEQLIRAIQAESDAAVHSMDAGIEAIETGVGRSRAAGQALGQIRQGADDASMRVAEIARATDEQSQNSKLVARAVEQTSDQIQQISEAMAEQTKVADRMNETSQSALDMCQHVHRSTNEQRETGRYITASIGTITEMIQGIQQSIGEHRTASESVSEAVFSLLDNARGTSGQVPALNAMLVELRDTAEGIVAELSRFEEAGTPVSIDVPEEASPAAPTEI